MSSEKPSFSNYASEPGEPEKDSVNRDSTSSKREFMEEVDFELLEPDNEEDWAEIESWFDENYEDHPLNKVREPSQAEVADKPKAEQKSWIVKLADEPVAYFQLRSKGEVGEIIFAVKPSMRNKGLGRMLLQRAEQLPEVQVIELKVLVAVDNIAGQKVLTASGYVPVARRGKLIEFRKRIIKF